MPDGTAFSATPVGASNNASPASPARNSLAAIAAAIREPNVTVKTVAQLEVEKQQRNDEIDLQEKKRSEEARNTAAGFIHSLFVMSRTARVTAPSSGVSITNEIIECERQRRGEYSPEKATKLNKQQGSKAFVKVTDQKCTEAEAWLEEIFSQSEKPFMVVPVDEPEISPELKNFCRSKVVQWAQDVLKQLQDSGANPDPIELNNMMEEFKLSMHDLFMANTRAQALFAAQRMEKKICTQLQRAGFNKALSQFLYDLTTFPFAVLKTSVRMRNNLKYQLEKDGSYSTVEVKPEPTYIIERVSPFDMFFSPRQSDVNKGYLFERIRCSRAELNSMKGIPGFNDKSIDDALREFGKSGRNEWIDMEWSKLTMEGKLYTMTAESSDVQIDVLEYHGSLQGRLIKQWGYQDKDIEDLKEYEVTALLVGCYLIKLVIEKDPFVRPYFITSFYPMPDTVWGHGIAQKMRTEQNAVNATWRAMENNIAICSGPQAMIDMRAISGKENTSDIFPFKVWKYQSKDGVTTRPVDFFMPPSNADRLIQEIQFLLSRIDGILDIPNYQSGMAPDSPTPAKSLAMLMSASGKTIKRVVKNIDENVIIPIVSWFYRMNMKYDDDKYSKGALDVVVRGTFSMETEASRLNGLSNFIGMVTAPGSPFSQLFGRKGMATLVRPLLKQLKIDDETTFPTNEELDLMDAIDRAQAQQAQQAQAQQQQAQANFQNQKAVSEGTNRQAKMTGAINNSVDKSILSVPEARQALAQTSNMGATSNGMPQVVDGTQSQEQPQEQPGGMM